jgi:hypothetical protein
VPKLRIDAAIAATRVLRSCRCPVNRFRLIDDQLIQEHQALIARGRVARTQEPPNDLDDTHWAMDGASGRRSPAGAGSGRHLGASFLHRVTIAIDRDGRPAFRFAYRPATRKAAMWAAAGVDLPHVPAAGHGAGSGHPVLQCP